MCLCVCVKEKSDKLLRPFESSSNLAGVVEEKSFDTVFPFAAKRQTFYHFRVERNKITIKYHLNIFHN